MSASSRVFVVAGTDRALDVAAAVSEALRNALRDRHDDFSHYVTFRPTGIEGMYRYEFVFDGVYRGLTLHTNCSCDTDHITKSGTLTFMINCYGKYAEIMNIVALALVPFGDVYYRDNDSVSEEYERVW